MRVDTRQSVPIEAGLILIISLQKFLVEKYTITFPYVDMLSIETCITMVIFWLATGLSLKPGIYTERVRRRHDAFRFIGKFTVETVLKALVVLAVYIS